MKFLYLNIILAILPLILLILRFLRKSGSNNQSTKIYFLLLFLGFFSVIPVAILSERLRELLITPSAMPRKALIEAFLLAALPEEGMKFLVITCIALYVKKINRCIDGIIFAVIVSIGFACFENIYYSFAPILVVVLRIFTALPVHLISSGCMGYYIGMHRFYEKWNLLKGFLAAILIHGTYDLMLFWGKWHMMLNFLMIPLIIGSGIYLAGLYRKADQLDHLEGRAAN